MKPMTGGQITWLAILAALPTPPAQAQVIDSSASGFQVRSAVEVRAPRERVYRAVVDEVGAWWNPSHTFSGTAAGMTIDPRTGGCFCETLPDGGGVRHLTVIYVEPGKKLRLAGALGPLQEWGVAGSLTWEFIDAGDGTRVVITYTVGGFRPGGLGPLAGPVQRVLTNQLERLKRFLEGGPGS